MKTLFLISLLVVVSSSMERQDWVLHGTITDSTTGHLVEGVKVALKNGQRISYSDSLGVFEMHIDHGNQQLIFSHARYQTQTIAIAYEKSVSISMQPVVSLSVPMATDNEEVADFAFGVQYDSKRKMSSAANGERLMGTGALSGGHKFNTEEYATIHENRFHSPLDEPLSTFSIDVDAASYSNIRRFIQQGQLPPKDAVRIEEMINYFDYEYPEPKKGEPFSLLMEMGVAPWNSQHKLVHVGLQGRTISTDNLPASNLVFLLDVSGSMNQQNKLPLLKSAFNLLIDQLRTSDKVAIVVYAGAAGMVLNSVSGDQKEDIKDALDRLSAGGSTAGGAGIELAYKIAKENFIENGNNRIILATDGDFNVGESGNASMERLIEQKRNEGIFLTVLGFGMGNYKDSKMEILADQGNGNYAYIDTMIEAQKVLVNEFGGTMFTIAKDVKIQVEFNPAKVQAYRLVGYENRLLDKEDFQDDRKDAGELGAGHTVTALYEVIPMGIESAFAPIDLKYQNTKFKPVAMDSEEWMTLKLRYKNPTGSTSQLLSWSLDAGLGDDDQSSENFRWSAAVACFGMILRDSEFKAGADYAQVIKWAQDAKGSDKHGYRGEMIRIIETAQQLQFN